MKSRYSPLPLFIVISFISLFGFGSRSAQAQQFGDIILFNFSSTATGENPQDYGALLMDAAGNLYGATYQGGPSSSYCYYGCGTVFELVKSGNGTFSEMVLYNFLGNAFNNDGAWPMSGLITDGAGNLYGTTWTGGGSNYGTVYELSNSSGTYSEEVLHRFTGSAGDGGQVAAPLLMDAGGNLYGTTRSAGTYGYGVVFELVNSSGTYNERILYNFHGGSDGGWPYSGLIMDPMGNLYGTTSAQGGNGNGTVFELVNASGTYVEQTLHTFVNTPTDGVVSYSGLIVDGAGNLYGTTFSGGASSFGTVYELVCSNGTWPCTGTYNSRLLYSFTGNNGDGANPYAGLLVDASGNLYGTTYDRGSANGGTVFELLCSNETWPCSGTYSEKVLHSFGTTYQDGTTPESGVVMDAVGNLYGTTMYGGTNGYGTVYLLANTSTVTLTASPNPSTYGHPVTLTAFVNSSIGDVKLQSARNAKTQSTASGTVTWSPNTGCGPTTVSGGLATCVTIILPVGTDNVTATYNGYSSTIATQVNPAPTTMNITSVSPSSEAYGQDSPVTITAVLSWSGSGAAPTASAITIGGNGNGSYGPVSCGAPNGDTMTCTAIYTPTMADGVGNYVEIANFNGDSNYRPANGTMPFAITTAGSGNITVASSQNPSTSGQSVTFTATIPGQYGAITHKGTVRSLLVTGTVAWSSDTGCGTTAVSGGTPGIATCTTSTLPIGSDTVTANYSGDSNHSAGSRSVTQTVNQATSSTVVGSSLDPSGYGQAVNFTATVTGTNPTGTVQFNVDGAAFGSPMTLASGTALSASISTLAVGTHTVTATYSGDTGNAGSTGTLTGGQVVQSAGSNVTVASSGSPSGYGQSVTFTATISGSNGFIKRGTSSLKTPDVTGTVAWSSNTGCGTTSVTSGNPGVATCTTSTLPVGSDTVTANYSGDTNHSPGSASLTQTVNQATTTTAVGSTLDPSGYGQAVSFTATVTGSNPTGTVQFNIDGGALGSPVALSSGAAVSASISTLAVGTHTVTAVYSGDSTNAGSTGTLSGGQIVQSAGSAVTVASSGSPSVYGQPVTLTATISGSNGFVKRGTSSLKTPDVTGIVTWSSNTGCGTTSVTSGNPGVATCTTSSLPLGSNPITATYSGDSNHNGGTGTLSGGQTVNQAASSTTLASSPNPVTVGQPVTFTSAVTGQYGGAPTGTVTFYVGTTILGTSALTGGVGTLTYTFQAGGVHSVVAVYSGDSNFTTSTSPALTQSVTKVTSTTSLSSSLNPSVYGQAVTFTASVTSSLGPPTNGETVTFTSAGVTLGTATTQNGVATFTTLSLNAGTRNVKAIYNGDYKRSGSASTVLSQIISKAASGSTITSSQNPSLSGQAVTFTVTVKPQYGGTPTGTITFTDNGTSLGTATLSGGTATLTTSSLTTGKYTIKGSYGGDTNFRNSATGLIQTVN